MGFLTDRMINISMYGFDARCNINRIPYLDRHCRRYLLDWERMSRSFQAVQAWFWFDWDLESHQSEHRKITWTPGELPGAGNDIAWSFKLAERFDPCVIASIETEKELSTICLYRLVQSTCFSSTETMYSTPYICPHYLPRCCVSQTNWIQASLLVSLNPSSAFEHN